MLLYLRPTRRIVYHNEAGGKGQLRNLPAFVEVSHLGLCPTRCSVKAIVGQGLRREKRLSYSLQKAKAMQNPKTAPTTTSDQVWPWTSLTDSYRIPRRRERSLPSLLRAFDCNPAERRTPRASRTTIREVKSDTIKRFENPSVSATAALMEIATAAWLEGIPPVRQKKTNIASRRSALRALIIVMIALMSWAMRRLNNAERNIGLLKRLSKSGISKFIAIQVSRAGKIVSSR